MKIPEILKAELERCGLPYRFELGAKHIKIILDGVFVGILPRGARKADMGGRGGLNVRSNIRRLAREKGTL